MGKHQHGMHTQGGKHQSGLGVVTDVYDVVVVILVVVVVILVVVVVIFVVVVSSGVT
jgi:flagellar basal body-associated protein FliL